MSGLTAHHVSHRFGRVAALDDVSVAVAPGTLLALVGESGSGKTTLLRCFNALVTPDAGEIRIGDVDVRSTDTLALRRRIGYVQQDGGLLPHWTVLRNVGLVPRASGTAPTEERTLSQEALAHVGLDADEFGDRYPGELSGGQRQRVALARALAAKPDALLLDEPLGALDALTRAEMQEALDRVRRSLHLTTILVTHDLAEAARLADSIVVLRAGRVEQAGTIADLRDAPSGEYVRALVRRAIDSAKELVS